MPKANKHIFFLIGFFTLIRLVAAPLFGLGVDEAHYVLYAKYLAWSYVDHPPLVGWVHAPLFYIFGTNEFLSPSAGDFNLCRRFLLCLFIYIKNHSIDTVVIMSVLALNCSFMLNALGLMLLPDSFCCCLFFC